MTASEYFRRNIRYLRKAHRLTQAAMGEILGVSGKTVGRMERGLPVRMNMGMLRRVCCYFRISADTMLGMELEKEGPDA